MAVYALAQRSNETYDAAGKAIRDVYTVLEEFGMKRIWCVPKNMHKVFKLLDLPYLLFFLLLKTGKRDFVFYSIPENDLKIKILKMIQEVKRYQIVCFINDINAFRYGNLDSEEVQKRIRKEIDLINKADHVVAPNKNTIRLFRDMHVRANLIETGVWDYLMKQRVCKNKRMSDGKTHIAFAGNLNKSEFIKYLRPDADIVYELWGKLEEEKRKELPEACIYHGVLKAEEVPAAICNCDFGLVWDGTGKNEIEGGLGEYLRYNNSHKCGLYLAAGVTPIVWNESGMSHFIRENECGILISSLEEIPQKIMNADRNGIQDNVERVGEEVRKGTYLRHAFKQIFA